MTFSTQFGHKFAVPLIVGSLLAAFMSPAMAQSTKERLSLLEVRMDRIERIVSNNDSEANMLQRIQALQKENQALRNAIETLQFETVQGAERQRQLYLDLDQRMQGLEASGSIQSAAGGAAVGAAATGSSDRQDYQAAFALLKESRYPEASVAFQKFLNNYPDSDLRDNAQYWLAETFYVTQDFPAALSGFQLVISDYPASRKIPDAWLKIGYCNYEQKNWNEARQALSIAKTRFPETTAARLADQRLELMQAEGH